MPPALVQKGRSVFAALSSVSGLAVAFCYELAWLETIVAPFRCSVIPWMPCATVGVSCTAVPTHGKEDHWVKHT
jgi:hypothetical protein